MKEAINNLELILPLLEFKEEGDFYHMILMVRKKDFTTERSNHQSVRTIKTYTIYSKEYLLEKWDEIKGLCEFFKARAYISVNRLNNGDVALKMIEKLVHCIQNGSKNVKGTYDSVVGSLPSKRKLWIVDLDSDVLNQTNVVESYINTLEPVGNKVVAKIPTKSGLHLITTPFRMDMFQQWCKDTEISVDVQKLNPTLAYVPQSLMNQV